MQFTLKTNDLQQFCPLGTQAVINPSESDINETLNAVKNMNAATLNQEDALTFRKVTPARLPANRSVVEPTPEPPSRLKLKIRPKPARRKKIIAGAT
jgi:hypothetical protein